MFFPATVQKIEQSLSGKADRVIVGILLALALIIVLIALFAPRAIKLAAIPYILLP